MKKLFTILCAVMLTFSLAAQTEAGTIMLEGSSKINYSTVSISSIEVDGDELDDDFLPEDAQNTMAFTVSGSYFITDGLAAGLLLDYNSSSEGDYSSNSMQIGPMVRYYVGESGLWSQLAYLMGSSSSEYDGDSEDGPATSTLSIGVGYSAWLSDVVSLSPSLQYAMITSTQEFDIGGGDVDQVTKAGGIVFGVGIAVHLGN